MVGGDKMDGITSEECIAMVQFIGDNYPHKNEGKKTHFGLSPTLNNSSKNRVVHMLK